MKRILYALAGALLATSATAADLPMATKAPPVVGYPLASGMYYGVAVIGDANSISGTNVPGATQLQGGGGLVVGYTWPISGSFAFVEASGYVQNINGAGLGGFSLSGPVKFQETVGFGADGILQTIAGFAPFGNLSIAMPSLPILPQGVTVAAQHMYFHVTAEQADVTAQFVEPTIGSFSNREWLFRLGGGVGIINRLSNNTALDLRLTAFADTAELCVGPFGCPKQSFGLEQTIAVKW